MATSGRLTDGDMDRLEEWIGKGPKTFTLLYAITRNGCDASTFHQKCDNQGPTVTVLYNQLGSVYGGYASRFWDCSGSYINTSVSFLFQLHYCDSPKSVKFLPKQENYAHSMYCSKDYGPTFGGNHDLHTFTNTVKRTRDYFPLNGYLTMGHSYDPQGQRSDQINNGTMNVTELEVYKVSDGQRQKSVIQRDLPPWRQTVVWSEELLNELKQEFLSFKPREDVDVTEARILMLGPIGAEKSSFYNTINSVFRGRITHRACSGSAEKSLTKARLKSIAKEEIVKLSVVCCLSETMGIAHREKRQNQCEGLGTEYTPYMVNTESGSSLKFRLCDTRGLEESAGISEGECNFLLDGNIPEFYQFSSAPITLKSPGFKLHPTANDQIHCVVFVLDSTTLDVLATKLVEKIKAFQNLMNHRGIPQLIVLTKIDKLCKDVESDVSQVFNSKTVEQHVEKASQLLGLPRGNVLPVKNYEREIQIDENVNILALLALRQILNFAQDFLDNLFERNKVLCEGMEKLQVVNVTN